MASEEIIGRIKRQLNDGFIDMNETNDIDEMDYIRKAIYDLKLYDKELEKACYELCTYCDGCEGSSLKYVDGQLKQLLKKYRK